ncbi:MAG: hypothetical protein D6690_11335 [Nitrospirae bacterium]|nr:MAG: hypothetical protein D6690_11335 [Nitrospirota bacterium]
MTAIGGLPLLGVLLRGDPIAPYVKFPPAPISPVIAQPFSWPLFLALGCAILIVLAPFLSRWIRFPCSRPTPLVARSAFPWWGWVGFLALGFAWTLAWTRFSWFEPLQSHTFTPLWLSYIVIVNALTVKRIGYSMLTDRTRDFLLLFPLSAIFWWTFEYLNRFVRNWYYVGTEDFDAFSYFVFATIPFSTVLPAVLGTYEWLHTFPSISEPFRAWKSIPLPKNRLWGWIWCLAGGGTLLGIGMRPEMFYPFLWLSPLMVIIGYHTLIGNPNSLDRLAVGDWRPVVLSSLAALICGFFWELWNSRSLAHWEYAIPYVHGFQIFEMPLLGYAGYLPFGLMCLLFVELTMPSPPLICHTFAPSIHEAVGGPRS